MLEPIHHSWLLAHSTRAYSPLRSFSLAVGVTLLGYVVVLIAANEFEDYSHGFIVNGGLFAVIVLWVAFLVSCVPLIGKRVLGAVVPVFAGLAASTMLAYMAWVLENGWFLWISTYLLFQATVFGWAILRWGLVEGSRRVVESVPAGTFIDRMQPYVPGGDGNLGMRMQNTLDCDIRNPPAWVGTLPSAHPHTGGGWGGAGLVRRGWALPSRGVYDAVEDVSERLSMLVVPFLAMDWIVRQQRVLMSFALTPIATPGSGGDLRGPFDIDVRPRGGGMMYLDKGQRSETFESADVERHYDFQVPDEADQVAVWRVVEPPLLDALARRPGVGIRTRDGWVLAYTEGPAALRTPLNDVAAAATEVAALLGHELAQGTTV